MQRLECKTIFSPFKPSTMFRPKDIVPDFLKSRFVYQFIQVLMSVSFGTKIPTFLNISVLIMVVGINVIFLVLRFSIMPALILSLK